jgi:hypothetical protein
MSKKRQYRSNQGKTPKQRKDATALMFIGLIGMIISLGVLVLKILL